MTAGFSPMSMRAVSVRYPVAPAPTGSRIIGTPLERAHSAAMRMEPTVLSFRVPMFRTVADEIATISGTSSTASVITGDPPAQMHTLAQSFTVT